jgi:hypothetical protein
MFVALTAEEYVEAAAELPRLLALLEEVRSPDVDEDLAVWHGARLVVVQHPDGRLTWLRPEYREAAAAAGEPPAAA